MEKSIDKASLNMIEAAKGVGVDTVWDRYQAMLPQCGFGELGICCRNCLQGPCKLDPFEEGPQKGICGATADTMVARNLARMIAGGTAAHSGHAKHIAKTLLKVGRGEISDYEIKSPEKLRSVAARIGIEVDGKDECKLAEEVALAALADFSRQDDEIPLTWAATTVTSGRVDTFVKNNVVPYNIDAAISQIMHRTTYGVDADPINLLLAGVECALADYAGCHIATDLSDILFGVPQPVVTEANLGVLKKDAVNLAVHGHNPILSEMVVAVADEFTETAKGAGATEGINIVGICCTGNEVLMRHGTPLATNSVSQELAITTGVLDAVVVDFQCIMPALPSLADCYHTKIITTMPIAKIPGAIHIEFDEETAKESARRILQTAVETYKNRDPRLINIPSHKNAMIAGFSAEAIIGALSKVNAVDPLQPLIDNIANGNIQGVALFAGCNNVKVTQDLNHITMVKELAKRNVLILATGCAAIAFGKHGILTSQATEEYAGDSLKTVLTAVGQAAGLNAPLPPVLHTGSCVDNTRAVDIAVAIANKLGVDLHQLPVVATAPEAATEKAVSIGTWAMAAGLPVHVGVAPPVLGSSTVAKVLTESVKDIFGGYFIVELDPVAAAEKLYEAIQQRRAGLGI